MKKLLRKLLLLLLALVLVNSAAAPVFTFTSGAAAHFPDVREQFPDDAVSDFQLLNDSSGAEGDEEPSDPGETAYGITSEESLNKWIEEHAGGGTVLLEAEITIRNGISGGYGGHIIIDAGRFGLIYDGGNISLYDFEIVGEGVDTPVVTVIDAGPNWGLGNWNNNLAFKYITAYGREGLGGVALHVTQGDGAAFDLTLVDYENCLIRSYGEGAIGILLDEPLDIYCFKVETDGMNSVAVSAPYGAVLFYCRLNAAGAGAAAVSGNGITLDACAAYPSPLDATVITRAFSEVSGKRFYLPVRQDDSWIWPENFYTFWMLGSDGSETRHVFLIEWDLDVIDAINTGVLGSYAVQGDLMPVFQGFGLTDSFPLTLTIEVRDPDFPCIAAIYFSDWDGNKATLDLWNEYDPTAENVILWRSDDGGETWRDFTNSPDLEWPDWNRRVVIFQYGNIASPIMFCLEVAGLGESNVVTLYEKDGVPYGDSGGDRTGTDRQGGGDHEFKNPGDAEPGAGGNNGGDGNNGGNGAAAPGLGSDEGAGNNEGGVSSGNPSGNRNYNVDTTNNGADIGVSANTESVLSENNPVDDSALETSKVDPPAYNNAHNPDLSITGAADSPTQERRLSNGNGNPTARQNMRMGIGKTTEELTGEIEFPDLQTPLAQPFASVDGIKAALIIVGAASVVFLSVLAFPRFRRPAKVKK